MLSKRNSRIVTIILAVAILSTMFVGFASASEPSAQSFGPPFDYAFWMRAPGGGEHDTATIRTKKNSASGAFFGLEAFSNSTDKEAYLNVRHNGTTVAGTPEIFRKGGIYKMPCQAVVLYSTEAGYGKVNDRYCPSCMSSSTSSSSGYVYFEGTWTP